MTSRTIRRQVRFGRSAQRLHSLAVREMEILRSQEPSRVARIMALAIHLQQLIHSADSQKLSGLARAAGLSRSRVSQIVSLNLLAPDIQEAILDLRSQGDGRGITERDLRPLVRQPNWTHQRTLWRHLHHEATAIPADRLNPDAND